MSESKIHFRRCHCCGSLNQETDALVTACRACGKHLAAFCFFDESKAMGLEKSNFDSRTTLPHKEYPPVVGLTVYWEFEKS